MIIEEILNSIYPKPHIINIVGKETDIYHSNIWFGVRYMSDWVTSGFYYYDHIKFLYDAYDTNNKNREYLINKLIKLNIGVIDIQNRDIILVLYKDLKDVNI